MFDACCCGERSLDDGRLRRGLERFEKALPIEEESCSTLEMQILIVGDNRVYVQLDYVIANNVVVDRNRY